MNSNATSTDGQRSSLLLSSRLISEHLPAARVRLSGLLHFDCILTAAYVLSTETPVLNARAMWSVFADYWYSLRRDDRLPDRSFSCVSNGLAPARCRRRVFSGMSTTST